MDLNKEIEHLEEGLGENSSPSSLSSYLKTIKNFKNLRKEEENLLLERKTPIDVEKIINSHLRLVVSIVEKLFPYNLKNESDFMDLIQAGNIGLIEAINTFDPTKNNKFSTHAYYWISSRVRKEISEKKCGLIKKPKHVLAAFGLLLNIENKINSLFNRLPTQKEVNLIFSGIFSEDQIKDLLLLRSTQTLSLDMEYDDDKETLSDFIGENSVEESFETEDQATTIRHKIQEILNPRLYLLICARYGIGEFEGSPKTLEEISHLFVEKGFNDKPISTERVRQLEEKAIDALQHDAVLLKLFNN